MQDTAQDTAKYILYHRIVDSQCVAVRKRIVEMNLKPLIDFRNVDVYSKAAQELKNYGSDGRIPALWDGVELFEGANDIFFWIDWRAGTARADLVANFDRIAHNVWKNLAPQIPQEARERIAQIRLYVEDHPSQELLRELPPDMAEHASTLCGLHVGVSINDSSITQPEMFPSRVYLFREALVDMVGPSEDGANPEELLAEEIAVTLLHEIGHDLGLSEEDLERLGYD